jgi:LacI family transcriptional regulator
MKIGLKDVAKQAGVSIATVSNVLNDTKNVSAETRERVLQAVSQLDYRVNLVARNLKSGQSPIVVFVVADIANLFFTEVARGIESSLASEDYTLLLLNSDERFKLEEEKVSMIMNFPVAGLIIAPTTSNHDYLKHLVGDACPLVFIDRKPRGIEGDCILSCNMEGAYEATEFFIRKGHTKIGLISGIPSLTTSSEREEGYLKALHDHGLSADRACMRNGDGRQRSGYQLMQELFSETDITAILVTNNSMTIGAFSFLKENSVAIPDRIAIIGFDDSEWAPIATPPVTIVKQLGFDIGLKAASILLNRLGEHAQDTPAREYRVPTRLIVRASA